MCYNCTLPVQLLREPPRTGQVGALVLSPTRELAMQIHTETEKLLRFHKLKVQVCEQQCSAAALAELSSSSGGSSRMLGATGSCIALPAHACRARTAGGPLAVQV